MTRPDARTCVDPQRPDVPGALMACPSGHPYVCSCGEPLVLVRLAKGDNAWADMSGVSAVIGSVDPAPGERRLVDLYVRDQAAFWQHLRDTNMALYSSLSAAAHLGMWPPRHAHRPESCHHLAHDFDPPFCHDQPMQASRDGWRCRATHAAFPYVEAAA